MTRAELFAWAEAIVEERGGNLIPPIRRDLGDREPELILSQLNVVFEENMMGAVDTGQGATRRSYHYEPNPLEPDEEAGNLWD